MYYRYKVHKKEKKGLKRFLILILIGIIGYFGYTYRSYLLFWKYTTNSLMLKIEKIEKSKDISVKRQMIEGLFNDLVSYQKENQVDAQPFLLTGKVCYLYGETYLDAPFTELFIKGQYRKCRSRARVEFYKSIRYLHKAKALLRDEELSPDYALILAKACFYTEYISDEKIYKLLSADKTNNEITNVEDLRFYVVLSILNGHIDESLTLLKHLGKVDDNIYGMMFLAGAECLAKQYTNSIMHYKKILELTQDRSVLKQVHVSLGKIFFNQSLYKESLAHFINAINLDNEDSSSKIWLGKNYFAMGNKDKARAIWSEVLTSEINNDEVKKLLGIM